MTEEEKYCGKGYVPKVNKGEAKQEQWIEVCSELPFYTKISFSFSIVHVLINPDFINTYAPHS